MKPLVNIKGQAILLHGSTMKLDGDNCGIWSRSFLKSMVGRDKGIS